MHDEALEEILEKARLLVPEIAVDEAHRLFEVGGRTAFVDIREPEELSLGYIKGAVFIRADELEMQARHLLPDKAAPAVLYCDSGIRSLLMAQSLKEMGYRDVRTLAGGIEAWKAAGYEVVTSGLLTLEQLNHYSRQVILREIGVEGQRKLLDARVLLVGAGGLGSSAAIYLAASGVGTIGIVDFDRVDKSNLNRQIIHGYGDIGRPKVESAKEAINRLNPEVNVVTHKERLSPQNALAMISEFDIVLDGSDNFPTKYLLNDASFLAGKPYVFGAAVQFHGQASVFYPKGGGPCLRCMMPTPPREDLVPTWSEVGVLGVVPGQIGLIQATEALKLLLGKGNPLIGRFLIYDALGSDFKVFTLKKNEKCLLCGANRVITSLEDRNYRGQAAACAV